MSSNRLIYDQCAYKKRMQESTGSYSYSMYQGKYDNSSKCRIELGQVGGNGVSLYSGNLVDLESDLRGQSRPASLCPSKKFHPECTVPSNGRCSLGLPCAPNNNLVHQKSCQMVTYPPTPQVPPFKEASCPQVPTNPVYN